jgi:ABC-type multidrug transport system fused ATPase/permease subunit
MRPSLRLRTALPFLLLVTVRFSRRLQPILKDVQQRLADVTAAAEENVVGSRIVRIFAREGDELEKFSDRSYKVFEASVAAARTRAKYIPLIAFIPNLAVAFLLYYGGRQVIDGSLSLGSLVAFYSYLMMLVYPAQVIGWLTGLAQRAIASGERVYEVLDSPLEMTERPDAKPLTGPLGPPASRRTAPWGVASMAFPCTSPSARWFGSALPLCPVAGGTGMASSRRATSSASAAGSIFTTALANRLRSAASSTCSRSL